MSVKPLDCPLCGRLIPQSQASRHHLIPRAFKGKEVVVLHKVCHRKIHSVLTERQLLKHYHTIPQLLMHTDIAAFVDWIKRKPPEFYVATRTANSKRKR